ncbi:MAG: sulfatase-like hydrolase/transferase [Cyclobacteriaceae bacterium]
MKEFLKPTRQILSLFLMSLWILSCTQSAKDTSAKQPKLATQSPNIVLIVADDLGYPYAGFMGDTIVKTPHLDRLAEMGTVFTQGMVTESHCAPSLRTLITGLHAEEFDLQQAIFKEENRASQTANLSSEDSLIWEREYEWKSMSFFQTLPKYLREKNYTSFQGGKWWEYNYQNGGFTEGMSTGWSNEDRGKKDFFYKLMGNEGLKLGRVTNQPVYDFVDKQKDNPFFVWYAPDLPHYPLNAAERYYNIYANEDLTESAKRYYANITWFDDNIGELMSYFEKKGLMENTLFIYVNDNGWDQEPNAEYRHDSLRWHNGGPKGKGSYYDLTFRTPIIFTWKGTLPSAQVKNELISSMDVLPTILDYVAIQKPDHLRGRSYRPNIEQGSAEGREMIFGKITQLFDPNDKTFMGKAAEGYWVRTPKYHYVWDLTNKKELLFDMEDDPKNDQNIAAENSELTVYYQQEIEKWKQEIGIE